MKPNIIFYFSDQQRADTLTEELMPEVYALAKDGLLFESFYTCQPVCGPARACLQTGQYATENGCYKNGIPLSETAETMAHHFNNNGYDTAYIGKWHLASGQRDGKKINCEASAIPTERQGGYKYFRGADVLEFTSHGYDGYIFDEKGNRIDFTGYRADCINDFALEYIENCNKDKPFFMFVSQLEPHHQNDRGHFEGPTDTVNLYKDSPLPEDLTFLKGNYKKEYPDYLAAIGSLDKNVGRLVKLLKDKGMYDNTLIIYTSDHGCHFKTRNSEYKRSCHESSIHIPLVFGGGAVKRKGIVKSLGSLIDLPPTILDFAEIDVPSYYSGNILPVKREDVPERECVFVQISESHTGRAVRTHKWKYSARAIGLGVLNAGAVHYRDDYLYDMQNDPFEKNNLVKSKAHREILSEMRALLSDEMVKAGEKTPVFHKALKTKSF